MTPEAPRLPLLRPLGVLEKFMVARSQLGVYQKVAVAARYKRAKLGGDLDQKKALYAALAVVISQHPNLSIVPVNLDSPEPSFARLPSVDLDQVIKFVEVEDELAADGDHRFPALDRILETEHSQSWNITTPPTLPLWRLHVLQQQNGGNTSSSFILCYFFHHSIGDTKSALVFHQALEAALNRTRPVEGEGEPVSKVRTISRLPLLPPLDYFVDTSATGGSNVSQGQEAPDGVWTGAVQSLPVKTRFRSLWLTADETSRFLRVCKDNGVSLTAALHAMLVGALFGKLPQEYRTVKIDCAISLRDWLPDPVGAESMGVFVDTFFETYQRPVTVLQDSDGPNRAFFSWTMAKESRKRIERVVQERKGDGLLARLSQVQDVESWTVEKMGQRRTTSLELSNVGKIPSLVDVAEKEKHYLYVIESLVFSQSAGALSGAIKVSCVTGRDGRLVLGFTWQEGVVDEDMVDGVMSEFQLILYRELHLKMP
ncbi:Alcohol acetyltransferase [Exophiala xenobiotica]|nr:Alcohol acetyltransferase [Exophiala xenobiotica]KAK5235502.1 Alcohol acetyltransferase [Exophiala xenobiotica]KAK5248333.1 Alcohol acetyltransferase [Exophiala xenobiotica]KAK5347872.1 Alcohol acetyltransferase [Exophiala xenobiotica]KAK5369662.1 hypothetical protein LTR11_006994 [Exophiala xenobiotica]